MPATLMPLEQSVDLKARIPPTKPLGAEGGGRSEARGRIARLGAAFVFVAVCGLAVSGAAQAANGSVVYSYDALGRIATASYDTGVFVTYSYDANGNRLSQTVNVNIATGTWNAFSWGQALW